MNDLDKAIEDTRNSVNRADTLTLTQDHTSMEWRTAVADAVNKARYLLAALNAARGEAVAWRVWRGDSYELFFSEDAARRRCQCFVQQRSPEPLYAAPPAAVFKSTAKRVAALQARDAAQAPPAALAVPEGYAAAIKAVQEMMPPRDFRPSAQVWLTGNQVNELHKRLDDAAALASREGSRDN